MILSSKKSIYIVALISAPICGVLLQLLAGNALFSIWDIPIALFSLLLLFAWYRLDTDNLGLKRRLWGNSAFVYLTFIAMPVYLFKTRGAIRGVKATLAFFAVVLAWSILETLGSSIAALFLN